MDADTSHDAFSSPEDHNFGDPQSELDSDDMSRRSSFGDAMRELESAGEIVTRFKLNIACACEKLINLNILVMHVETRESDFEVFVSGTEHDLNDLLEKSLEFDLLSGILDSEVRELESFMSFLHKDVGYVREVLYSCKYLGESLTRMEEQLYDSEKSLNQSLEQVLEIKVQSTHFQRILSSFDGEGNWKDEKENVDLSGLTEKIKMQTAEHQRHILRMLEKSLAKELDLEKKLTDSRQLEEDMKLRLHSSEQVVIYMEEEAEMVLERLFEAENASEVLMGVSKELLGQLQLLKFNLNGSVQREEELSSKLQGTVGQLKAKDTDLQKLETSNAELSSRIKEVEEKLAVAESLATNLKDQVILLESQLKESEIQLLNVKGSADGIREKENMIKDLKEKVSEAEGRAESEETKYQLLTETRKTLDEELSLLKSSGITSERVNSLEKELSGTKIQLQHAVASAEASQEKQNMLYSTIKDMENLIEDLKSKVLKAENLTESTEEKCISLSVANMDLNEELSLLRGRMECLEVSLQLAEETKKATAKDISLRTSLITDLIMQMALERERLQKQISLLKQENKILRHLKTNKYGAEKIGQDGKGNGTDSQISELDLANLTRTKESKEEPTESPIKSSEPDKSREETVMGPPDFTSEFETARNIDAWQLSYKYVVIVLVLVIPVLGILLLQNLDTQV